MVAGMTTAANTTDGGFALGAFTTSSLTSSKSYGINLTAVPGVLYFNASPTDRSTNLVGNFVANCEDPNTVSPVNRLYLAAGSTGDGTFYTFNGTTLSLVATDSTRDYAYGVSDMSPLGSYVYGTSKTFVFEWQVSAGTVTQNYYDLTATYSNAAYVPHPTLQYENNWFCGNGNVLLRLTAAGGTPAAILTLDTGQVIVALGMDPGTGKMLISTSTAPNINDTNIRTAKVLYYDGFSNKVSKSVIVDDMITAFYPVGATMYIGYGLNLGTWDGAGIKFLRALQAEFDSTYLPYKNHFSNVGSTLLVVEKNFILAYGPVMGGTAPCFRRLARDANTPYTMVNNLGSNVIGVGQTGNVFKTIDLSSTASMGSADWFSLRYTFERPITFNQVVIEYFTALPTDNSTVGVMQLVDDRGGLTTIKTVKTTISNTYTVECPWPTMEGRSVQLNYSPSQNYGIKRMTIFINRKD